MCTVISYLHAVIPHDEQTLHENLVNIYKSLQWTAPELLKHKWTDLCNTMRDNVKLDDINLKDSTDWRTIAQEILVDNRIPNTLEPAPCKLADIL